MQAKVERSYRRLHRSQLLLSTGSEMHAAKLATRMMKRWPLMQGDRPAGVGVQGQSWHD